MLVWNPSHSVALWSSLHHPASRQDRRLNARPHAFLLPGTDMAHRFYSRATQECWCTVLLRCRWTESISLPRTPRRKEKLVWSIHSQSLPLTHSVFREYSLQSYLCSPARPQSFFFFKFFPYLLSPNSNPIPLVKTLAPFCSGCFSRVCCIP